MKILAVDTATKTCSAAVMDNDTLLSEVNLARTQTHSRHLMDVIDTAVSLSGLDINDMDGFAVTKGPGSFTGLRIGISTVKGLAVVSGKPLVGILTLDALAFQFSSFSCPVCIMLDARKGEVYYSLYRFKNGSVIKDAKELVLPPERVIDGIKGPCLFAGDGAITYKKNIQKLMSDSAVFASEGRNMIRASSVAAISLEKFKNGDTDDVSAFVPFYIRKSEAEINLEKVKG